MITGPKLIFVDGIMGSGKSRLAQRLWLHLWKTGHDAEWFAEPQAGHPLHDLGDFSGLDKAGVLSVAMQAWRNFVAERQQTTGITILDATLLQTTVRSFEAFGVPRFAWQFAFTTMLRIAEPLSPVLIYLRPASTVGFVDWLAATRGADWSNHASTMFADRGGLAGLDAYCAERLEQDLALIDQMNLPSTVLATNRDDWDEHYFAACKFLGLDAPEPVDAYPGDITRLADRYHEPVSGASWDLEMVGGRLGFLAGDRPRLMHVHDTRFVLEGRPLDATFTLDALGRAQCLRFSGPLRDDLLPGTEWYRVAG